MALWTDIIDPAELTRYVRRSLADYEVEKGTLARWLPNSEVADVVVKFMQGSAGLVDVARWRAFNAAPQIGKAPSGKRITLELPAVGQNIPIDEYNQLRSRSADASDDAILLSILKTSRLVARAVSDSVERVRGIVLQTGKATITQDSAVFMDDDFGRAGGHTVTAGTTWATASTDALGMLNTWSDTYVATNGVKPGAILTSTRVVRLMGALTQFATQLGNGGSRPATPTEVQTTLEAWSLPPIYVYDRQVSVDGVATKVLADDKLIFVPAPVDPNTGAEETELGATFWGQTLTSTHPDYELASEEQPGLVVGAYRGDTPPMIAEVISDAIALPVLANANLSFVADVIP